MSGQHKNRWLLFTLIFGGLVRLIFLYLFRDNLSADPDAYRQIAEAIVNEGVYGQRFGDGPLQPTAFRPPLYPLLLTFFVWQGTLSLKAVAILHWACGVATLFFTFRLLNNVLHSHRLAAVGSCLVACDPILLKQSTLIMTETVATLLAACLLWLCSLSASPFRRGNVKPQPESKSLHRRSSRQSTNRLVAVLGLGIGVATLCRPTFLIWGMLLVGWWMIEKLIYQRISWKAMLMRQFILTIGIVVVLTPWMIRNQLVLGKPVFATTHGGYTVFLGNNERFFDFVESGKSRWEGAESIQPTIAQIRKASKRPDDTINEVVKDQLYYEKAIESIRNRPKTFMKAVWIRTLRFWSVIPGEPDAKNQTITRLIRWGSIIWYLSLFLLGIAGGCSLLLVIREVSFFAWSGWLPGVLMIVAFQGLHLLYWSNMRMRAPLAIVIALLAVTGIRLFISKQRESTPSSNDWLPVRG